MVAVSVAKPLLLPTALFHEGRGDSGICQVVGQLSFKRLSRLNFRPKYGPKNFERKFCFFFVFVYYLTHDMFRIKIIR